MAESNHAQTPHGPGTRARASAVRTLILPGLVGLCLGLWIGQGSFGALEEPDRAMTGTGGDRQFVERHASCARALESASPGDIEEIRSAIESRYPGPHQGCLELFAGWWAAFEPDAAVRWAAEVDERYGFSLRPEVLRVWARNDVSTAMARALAYARANPAPLSASQKGALDPGVQGVIMGWDESLQPGLEEWIFEQPERFDRQGYMEILARHRTAVRDPAQVWEWAVNLPPALSRDMVPRIAGAIAGRDPELAVRLASPLLDRDKEFSGLMARISMPWSRSDPRSALEWLAGRPWSHGRDEAVLEGARTWTSTDRDGFFAYMDERLADFPGWLEPAFSLHARALANVNRAPEALEIARRLSERDLRNFTTAVVLRSWLRRDEDAAEAWIEAHDLSPSVLRAARTVPGSRKGTSSSVQAVDSQVTRSKQD